MNAYPDEVRKTYPDTNLLKRLGRVEGVATAICHLASPAAAFINGEVLAIDGGSQLWGDLWTVPRPDYFNAR